MKNIAFAFAATIAVSSFAVSAADAMNIGSLSRHRVATASDEIVTHSIPGTPAMPRAVQPKFQLIFFSLGSFLRDHARFALAEADRSAQLISLTSAQ